MGDSRRQQILSIKELRSTLRSFGVEDLKFRKDEKAKFFLSNILWKYISPDSGNTDLSVKLEDTALCLLVRTFEEVKWMLSRRNERGYAN